MTPETCPNCGADVPRNARACPECGACEATGWSEAAMIDELGLPEESFDYNEFVQREFGKKKPAAFGIRWFWWVVAVLLLIAFFLLYFRRF